MTGSNARVSIVLVLVPLALVPAVVAVVIVVIVIVVVVTVMPFSDPSFLDEVDGLAACTVPLAVAGPVLLLDHGHIDVDGLLVDRHR